MKFSSQAVLDLSHHLPLPSGYISSGDKLHTLYPPFTLSDF